MKKALVILLALALVFGLVLTACDIGGGGGGGGKKPSPTPEVPGGDLEWTVVFDMQDASNGKVTHGIQELTAGDIPFPTGSSTSPISPIVKAGEMPAHITSFEAVTVGGKIALKYVTVATWGPGFDLPNSAFGFRADDKITVTGNAEGSAIDLAFNVNQGGSQDISGGNRITEEGEFTVEIVLTAADITKIAGNEQKVIRFEDRKGATTVTITQIKIEGNRPSTITQLAAPVIALDESTISWTAVTGAGGYKVLADGDEVTELTSETSYNLALSDLDPGTYSITVVALGVAGSSSDSDPSNAVSYTKPVPDTQTVTFTSSTVFPMGGGAKDATVAIVNEGAGYTVETHENGYGNSWAYFTYSFTDGANLSDFIKVTVNYTGLSGDVGWKTLYLIVKEAADFASGGNYINFSSASSPVSSANYSNSGLDEQNLSFTIDQDAAAAFDGKALGFAFGIHAGDYEIQISDVVFEK